MINLGDEGGARKDWFRPQELTITAALHQVLRKKHTGQI